MKMILYCEAQGQIPSTWKAAYYHLLHSKSVERSSFVSNKGLTQGFLWRTIGLPVHV